MKMVSAEIKWRKETGLSTGEEVVVIEVDDGETFESKLSVVKGFIFFPNRENAASDNWGGTISGQQITLELVGTTSNVEGTLIVVGTP